MARIVRGGDFLGPNFVDGLAVQKHSYKVKSDTKATLKAFEGGFDTSITYKMTLHGTDFSKTADGRYTGIVEGFHVEASDGSSWTVTGYNAPLESVNTVATEQNFIENLTVPIKWEYVGNKFPDVFIGGSFGDTFYGFGGKDSFEGLGGDDLMYGGRGKDDLNGQTDNDTILGGRGNDLIRGGEGADMLEGNRGKDEIFGNNGTDTIRGGEGRDVIKGGLQGDDIKGGKGKDKLFGQPGADTINGNRGHDRVDGGDDTDLLFGGRGNDKVEGGDGNDFITGGRGDDILAGNTIGAVSTDSALDTFIFEGRFGHDIITDFELNWDSIRLLGIKQTDVKVKTIGDDVLVKVDHLGKQSILVLDVADKFDPNVDIVYG